MCDCASMWSWSAAFLFFFPTTQKRPLITVLGAPRPHGGWTVAVPWCSCADEATEQLKKKNPRSWWSLELVLHISLFLHTWSLYLSSCGCFSCEPFEYPYPRLRLAPAYSQHQVQWEVNLSRKLQPNATKLPNSLDSEISLWESPLAYMNWLCGSGCFYHQKMLWNFAKVASTFLECHILHKCIFQIFGQGNNQVSSNYPPQTKAMFCITKRSTVSSLS